MALVIVGIILAIPTIGLSLVIVVWGVFLMAPQLRCTQCAHTQRKRM